MSQQAALPAITQSFQNGEIKQNSAFQRPIRILIADDDVTNRLVLQGILSSQGYQAVHAENGQQAIELFETEDLDLILMDVMMPVVDGYTAATVIKQKCHDRFVPIIFLTAITDEEALAKCVESGGDDFLTKPYNHIILRARIDALLRITGLYNTISQQKHEIKVHQQRMEREEKMAESLFSNIIKSDALQHSYIKYRLSPMSLFNGDVLIAAVKPSGGINILLGDFTGHGMAAATGALPASNIFYEMTEKGYSVAEITAEMNAKMKRILPTGIFLAACIMEVNPVTRSITVWNGGLPDILVYSSKDRKISKKLASSHVPMGILEASQFDNRVEVVEVLDGDKIYIYSDGVIETTNHAGEMFGQERLEKIFSQKYPIDDMFYKIDYDLELFRDGCEQNDDVTIIEVTYNENELANIETITRAQDKAKHPAAHWHVSMRFEADVLRFVDPLPITIQAITEIQGLGSCRQQLYTILAELFSNSLEHGLLGLTSSLKSTPDGFADYYHKRQQRLENLQEGSIQILITHESTDNGGKLTIRVEDSGPGFDYKNTNRSIEDNVGNYGRGMPLLSSMCESVKYSGRGNIVEAIYRW